MALIAIAEAVLTCQYARSPWQGKCLCVFPGLSPCPSDTIIFMKCANKTEFLKEMKRSITW